jgi:hypothetical protein
MYAAVPATLPTALCASAVVGASAESAARQVLQTEVTTWPGSPANDVGGFQIAVDDALGMSGSEGGGDLRRVAECVADREPPAPNPLSKRLPLDQLHGDEIDSFDGVDFVDHHHVRMVDSAGRSGLAQKPRPPLGIRGKRGWQKPQRHTPFQSQVGRFVDDAHPAFTQLLGEAEVTKDTPDLRGRISHEYGRNPGAATRQASIRV